MARRVVNQNPHWNPSQGSAILTHPDEILDVLGKAARQLCAVSVKVRGSDQQFSSRLIDSKISKSGLQIELNNQLTSAAFKKEIERTKSKECLLLIFASNRYILGLNVKCVGINYQIIFDLPQKVFRLQRRKSVRYTIPAGYDMLLEMPSFERHGLRIKRKVLDISEHGLAFLVASRDEAALYTKNTILKNCKVPIRNHEITLNLKVMNRIEHNRGRTGGGTKVGTEISSISADDLDVLAHFVYSQLAQMMS